MQQTGHRDDNTAKVASPAHLVIALIPLLILSLSVLIFFTGGLVSVAVPFLLVIPLFATYFAGRRSGLVSAFAVVVILVALATLRGQGLVPSFFAWPGIEALARPLCLAIAAGLALFLGQKWVEASQAARQKYEEEMASHQKTSAELSKALAKVEAATKAKTDFLATMSHELRTPMNGVIGFIDLLSSSNLDPKQQAYAETIRKSSEGLLVILNDILDFSKLEEGLVQLDPHDFELHNLLDQACDLIQPAAEVKSLKVTRQYSVDLPKIIFSDGHRLRQILMNLLSNAVKFTEKGEIGLEAKLVAIVGEEVQIQFSVRDQGIGISEEAKAKLFQRFAQAETASNRRYGGTGLGLAISQELCRLMGGKIEIQSEVGKGATFSFTIKALTARGHIQAAVAHKPATSTLRPLKILVAEDNPVNQKLVLALLDKGHHDVTLAENGEAAVIEAQNAKFDLVLMDVQMPVMDGLEATRRLRAEPGPNQNIPIIAITANVLTGDRTACLDAGMNDFMPKPVRLPELVATLSRWAPSQARWN